MAKFKGSLSPQRQHLIREMQRINFGRFDCLVIRSGEPILDPRPSVIREHKFGGENGPRAELATEDFLLKQQLVELFAFFDQVRDGIIEVLEIKHGLPFRMIVREAAV